MSSTGFVVSAPVPATSVRAVSTCSFVSRPTLTTCAAKTRRASVTMQANPEDYKIGMSDFDDGGAVEDSGDGFIGSADMGEMLGVSMPDDLASFEINEISNAENRDQLVDKLREIQRRKKDIRDDRRRGLGLDNVGNYLDAL